MKWNSKPYPRPRRAGEISRKWLAASAFALVGVSAAAASAQVGSSPDYHVVQQGDTLYDLSGSYYGDVYQWPKMWSYNTHITNPHWIYPGDVIYLRPPAQAPEQGGEELAQQRRSDGQMQMPVAGFITREELQYAGRIVGSPKEANMLSPLDVAWIGSGEDAYSEEEKDETSSSERRDTQGDFKEGDLFAIVRELGEIKDSEGDAVGHKYIVLGSLRVDEVSDKYYDTATIVQAWREIERGDFLIPYERQLKVVEPVKSDKDMVAEIVDGMEALFDYGEFHYVFVNRGAADGIRPGNRFFVYHRREGLDFRGTNTDEKIPWRQVGQVMVLDVRENFSLAVVTDSKRELQIGDRLEMYEGY